MDHRRGVEAGEGLERAGECGGVGEREIPPSDGAAEQYVAAEDDAVSVEGDMPRSMSGNMVHREGEPAEGDRVTIGVACVRRGRRVEGDPVRVGVECLRVV